MQDASALPKSLARYAEAIKSTYVDTDKLKISQYSTPVALAPFVTQIYFFQSDAEYIREAQPAALGHLIFFQSGSGELHFHDGHVDPLLPVSIFGPSNAAAEFTLHGPVKLFGMALSPLGFAVLTGRNANECADKLMDAAEIFGSQITMIARRLQAISNQGELDHVQAVQMVTPFLLRQIRNIRESHTTLFTTVTKWLSEGVEPDVGVLYGRLKMSRSTASRLVTRYFGCTPKALMRKYRALRAASNLCDPNCTDERRAQIEALFYDQPHMIREIRHFTGRTPGALGGQDCKILRIWLSRDNYTSLQFDPG